MSSTLIEYQLRIRNAANTLDVLTITSIRTGTNPWLQDPPRGDGQEFDPLTGSSRCGAFNGTIVDGITSGSSRVLTSQLEDASFRQQLMDRRAFLEFRSNGAAWSVLIAGFLTALRLETAITYSFTVSDPTRAENDYLAFAPQLDPATGLTETFAAFLARWPNRGCIFGGPVRGGFLNQPDLGGWEMIVDSRSGSSGFSAETYLKFVAGYAPPNFKRSTNAEECATAPNEKTDSLHRPFGVGELRDSITTFDDAVVGLWPDVVMELVGVGFYQPMTGLGYQASPGNVPDDAWIHLVKDIRLRGSYIRTASLGTAGVPSAGTAVRVRCFTAHVSVLSPIYWTGHPVDLLAKLWTEAGLDYSSAALTTVRQAIGADLRLSIRITEPATLSGFLQAALYAPFGIGVRTNAAGQLEAFVARPSLSPTLPSTTITSADVILQPGTSAGTVFSIDRGTAIKTVVLQHTRLVLASTAQDASAVDGFVEQIDRWEIQNSDPAAVGNQTQEYIVPGMVHSNASNNPDISTLANSLALTVFDRYGRGIVEGEAMGLRGGSTDGVALGDMLIDQRPQLPNHNYRLGDNGAISGRIMQVVRITPTPSGNQLKLADAGPNAQPYATVPTFTLAASALAPLTTVAATITNAATLNAVPAGVRVQMAVTTGATPAATDYVEVNAFASAKIPTTAFNLRAVTPGSVVWVKMRTEIPGGRPSTWSSAVSLTLSTVPPVTSAAVTPTGTDGSTAQATWVAGDTTSVIDIYLRASGAPFSAAIRQAVLPAGSTRFLIERLTPAAAYTVSIQPRNPQTGDVAALVDVTFTANATVVTLAAPVYASGFAGTTDPSTGIPQRDGVYGIAVVAAEFPAFVEMWEAVETSVGSGTYGTATLAGVAASVSGYWTIVSQVGPNDGLRRQLTARHVRDGATSSAFTSAVTVTPWVPLALPAYPTAAGLVCEITVLSPTSPGVNLRFQVNGVDPSGGTPQVKIVSLGSAVSIVSGPAVGTLSTNGQIWQVSQPGPGQGPGSLVVAAGSSGITAEATLIVPEASTVASPQGTVAIDANGNWEATADGPANALSFRYLTSTSAFPADATVLSSGTVVSGSRTFTITGGPLSFGQTIFITIIPYTQASGAGTALPSIHLRGAYLTMTATKTVNCSRASFQPTYQTGPAPTAPIYDTSASPTNAAMISGIPIPLVYMTMQIALPQGVTVSQASFDGVWNSATTALGAFNCAIYHSNSLLNSASFTSAGGAQTKNLSLSTTIAGPLMLLTSFTGPASGTADASQATVKDVAVTYSMPDPKKTI